MKELWVEKYRPKTIDEYVFRDEQQKKQVQQWIKEKTIPHLLFSGNAGIGKTTLAKVLFNELEVNDLDILEINASNENSVETIRSKITNFSGTMPFGDMSRCYAWRLITLPRMGRRLYVVLWKCITRPVASY